LVYTEGGRTKTLTLNDAEVAEVTAAVARYAAARADLEAAAEAGIQGIIADHLKSILRIEVVRRCESVLNGCLLGDSQDRLSQRPIGELIVT
jgi:hypothetical protein